MKLLTFPIAAVFVLGLSAGPAIAQQQPGMSGQQEQQRQQQPGMSGQQEQQRQQQQRETMGQQGQAQQRQQAQQGKQISPNQLSSDKVRELQQSLQAQGVSPGPIDGIMGPQTQKAIRQFQQEEGIAATGQLDEQTLEALDLDVQEFMGAAPAFEDQQQQQQREQPQQQQQQRQQPQQQQEGQQQPQQQGIEERMQERQQQ